MLSNMGPDRPAGRVCRSKLITRISCARIAAHGNRFLLANPDNRQGPGSGPLSPAGRLLGLRADYRHSLTARPEPRPKVGDSPFSIARIPFSIHRRNYRTAATKFEDDAFGRRGANENPPLPGASG